MTKPIQTHNLGITVQKHTTFKSIDTAILTVQKIEHVDDLDEKRIALDMKALSRITTDMVDKLETETQPILRGSVTMNVSDEDLVLAANARLDDPKPGDVTITTSEGAKGIIYEGNRVTDVQTLTTVKQAGEEAIRESIVTSAIENLNN